MSKLWIAISALTLLVLILLLILLCRDDEYGEQPVTARSEECPLDLAGAHEPEELIVRFVDDDAPPDWEDVLLARQRFPAVRGIETDAFASGGFHVRIPGASDASLWARAHLLANTYPGAVDYIQANAHIPLDQATCAAETATSNTPDDPCFSEQWALPKIGAPTAWAVSTGSHDVRVAVVDIGVHCDHPDLKANCLPDLGKDFYESLPQGQPEPGNHHGTRIAGIIGAVGNDGKGVVGVNWTVKILPLRAGLDVSVTHAAASEAIEYAADQDAQIVNASWGLDSALCKLDEAIAYAGKRDVLVVVAAGNDDRDIDTDPKYPASSNAENLLVVAATKEDGALRDDSNYGPCAVDLAAPGDRMLSTNADGAHDWRGGTSYAAPVVAGAAALLLAKRPDESFTDLKSRLLATAAPSDALSQTQSGGSLDLAAAITPASPPTFAAPDGCP